MYEARLTLFPDALTQRFQAPPLRAPVAPVPFDELVEQARAINAKSCQRLIFSGGSPLRHPQFRELVHACQSLGLTHFALETDGAPLAAPGVLDELTALGFESVVVVCGGIRQRVYDFVLRESGTFKESMQGIAAAMQHDGLPLYVVVPVLRANEGDIEPLLEWLLQLPGKVQGYLLSLPEIEATPLFLRSKLLLSYSEQAALCARVFRNCQGHNVEYGFASRRGILPCATGGVLDRFGTVFLERANYLQHETGGRFARAEACRSCSLSQSCAGVEEAYLGTFGEAELAAVPLEVSMGWKLRRINRLVRHDYQNVSPFQNDSLANPRGLVRINGHCNMSCSFCFVDRTVPDFEADGLLAEIEQMAKAGTKHLVLSGGEPTLHPDLPRIIARARTMGFQVIEMQSNGVKCVEKPYAAELVEAGLNKVTFSLHSVDPEKSDMITRLPRAFGKTIAAMHNFRELGVLTQIAHVITKANFEELPQTVRYLREEFPEREGHLSICFGIAQGISDLVFSWVIPTFTEVKPYFREALDYCLENGIGFGGMIGQGGYPPCMLDGELKYYATNLGNVFRSADSDEQFYKAERCRECSFDPYCVGVRRAYVQNYGDLELRPFQALVRADDSAGSPAPAAQPAPARAAAARSLPIVI